MNTHKHIFYFRLFAVTVVLSALTPCLAQNTKAEQAEENAVLTWNFEDITVGQIPTTWKIEATGKGPLATWEVVRNPKAPSGHNSLDLTRINHSYGGTFNLCWTDKISFLDGEIEVHFRANRGKEDQGGGIMWRVQDKDNYYVARFNPLEDNFRIYHVHNGMRKMLMSARIALSAGWHTLKIVQHGNKIQGHIDGRKLLEFTNDLFPMAGGAGLWTKADAATSFDNFTVKPEKEESSTKKDTP